MRNLPLKPAAITDTAYAIDLGVIDRFLHQRKFRRRSTLEIMYLSQPAKTSAAAKLFDHEGAGGRSYKASDQALPLGNDACFGAPQSKGLPSASGYYLGKKVSINHQSR